MRLITVWPFPEKKIQELAERVDAFVVAEMNQGQIMREVQRCAKGKAEVYGALNYGGAVLNPEAIYETIEGAIR
jgi:2-oxoglutarate ferredoxin oxidoreductase subunit alpha